MEVRVIELENPEKVLMLLRGVVDAADELKRVTRKIFDDLNPKGLAFFEGYLRRGKAERIEVLEILHSVGLVEFRELPDGSAVLEWPEPEHQVAKSFKAFIDTLPDGACPACGVVHLQEGEATPVPDHAPPPIGGL